MADGSVSDSPIHSGNACVKRPKRKRWGRHLLLLAVTVLLVVFAVGALFPTLICTAWGTSFLVGAVNRRIPGRVEIEGLRLAWGKGQAVQRVRLLDPDGVVALELETLAAPTLSIASLLRGGTDLGTVAAARLTADQDRVSAALVASPPPRLRGDRPPVGDRYGATAQPPPFPWLIRLEMAEASLIYGAKGSDPVWVSASDIVVDRRTVADLSVRGTAQVRQGDLRGTASLDVEAGEIFDEKFVFRPGRLVPRKVNLVANVLPTAFLDRMMGTEGLVSNFLGPILNARFDAMGGDVNDFSGTVDLHSDHLNFSGHLRNANDKIELTSIDSARLDITPTAYAALVARFPALAETRLQEAVRATLNVAALSVPVVEGALDVGDARLDMTVAIGAASVDAGDAGTFGGRDTRVTLTSDALGKALVVSAMTMASHDAHQGNLKINLRVEDLFDIHHRLNVGAIQGNAKMEASSVPMGFLQQFVTLPPGVFKSLGESVDATVVLEYDGTGAAMPVAATVRSSRFEASLHGHRETEGGWQLRGDGRVEVEPRLAQALVDHFAVHLPEATRGFFLHDMMHLGLTLETLELGKGLDPRAAVVAAELKIDAITLGGIDALAGLQLRDVAVRVPRSVLAESLSLALTAQLRHGARLGGMEISTKIDQPLGERGVAANIILTGLAVDDLAQRLNCKVDLAPYLGETIQKLQVAVRPGRQAWGFEVTASSDLLTVPRLTGRFGPKEGLRVESPGNTYRLKPLAVRQLFAGEPRATHLGSQLVLRKDVDLRFDIDRVVLPLTRAADGQRGIDWHRAVLKVRGGGDAVPLLAMTSTGQRLLKWDTPNLTVDVAEDRVEIELDVTLETVDCITGTAVTMPMTSRTSVGNLFAERTGGFAAWIFETETNLPNTPVEVVDAMLGVDGKLVAVIGASASMEITGAFPGALTLRMKSDKAKVNLATRTARRKNRYVVELLDENVAELTPDEEGFRVVLGEVHPVFSDAVAARQPIILTIMRDPFAVPLDFDEGWVNRLKLDLRIPQTTLTMRRRGWLTEAIGTLAEEAGRASKASHSADDGDAREETYDATFSPQRVTVEDGRITTSEFWVVSQDLAIGFQGGANLKNRRYRFFMGLVGASLLVEEPGLIQIVDPANVYDVPITGEIGGDPVVDKKELIAALAGSAAKQQLAAHAGSVGVLVDQLILKPQQHRRRKKLGLTWNVPGAVRHFIARTLKTMSGQQVVTPQKASSQEDAQAVEQEERGPNRVEDVVKDEINRALEGLFNR